MSDPAPTTETAPEAGGPPPAPAYHVHRCPSCYVKARCAEDCHIARPATPFDDAESNYAECRTCRARSTRPLGVREGAFELGGHYRPDDDAYIYRVVELGLDEALLQTIETYPHNRRFVQVDRFGVPLRWVALDRQPDWERVTP